MVEERRPEEIGWVVDGGDAGRRLDRFLTAQVGEYSRSQVQRAIRLGLVTVDGVAACKTGAELKEGQEVLFAPPPSLPSQAEPEDIPLNILHEDDHVVAVDKPPGLVVHPAAGHHCGTLVNALVFRYPEMRSQEGERPGIVHRLDKGTSGVMVVARTAAAKEGLASQFLARTVFKGYIALIAGEVNRESGAISRPIGRHPTDRKRFYSRGEGGRQAETMWRKVGAGDGYSVVAVRILTGRTHQIRVHLADDNLPVAGDDLYNPRWRQRAGGGPMAELLADGPMLHAAYLEIDHPVTGKRLCLTARPSPRFYRALEILFPGQDDELLPATVGRDFFPGGAR